MNILVIDCAVTRLSIAVKAEDKFISYTYDIGMRQSEILVPVIHELLNKAGISASELNDIHQELHNIPEPVEISISSRLMRSQLCSFCAK